MSDNRATPAIPRDAYPAIMNAVLHAVMDKGASKITRKAAFTALLALVEAGLIIGDAATCPARTNTRPTPAKGLQFNG